ncbi:hypothetical protein [Propionivibrio limicola]|uniref:hypothetical protein n=1 Tax=Propionivibrio limicola TaxID=167645 RepID=UPI001290D71E|nr:hypothetical protein [Propionivibrio limicola]
MDRRDFLFSLTASALSASAPVIGLAKTVANTAPQKPFFSQREERLSQVTPPLAEIGDHDLLRVVVVAIGGAGGDITARLRPAVSYPFETVAVDTDLIGLNRVPAQRRILLGSGGQEQLSPNDVRLLAKSKAPEITSALAGADIVLIISSLGGGAGTGAAPVVAAIAHDLGALTVGVPVLPFPFEGLRRNQIAAAGLNALARRADIVVPISNADLLHSLPAGAPFSDVFAQSQTAIENVYWGIAGVTALQGLVSVDLEDIRTTLAGTTTGIGWGHSQGTSRTREATQSAMQHPLLGIDRLKAARGIQVSIRAERTSLKIREINDVMTALRAEAQPDAMIIFGANYHEASPDMLEVSILAA